MFWGKLVTEQHWHTLTSVKWTQNWGISPNIYFCDSQKNDDNIFIWSFPLRSNIYGPRCWRSICCFNWKTLFQVEPPAAYLQSYEHLFQAPPLERWLALLLEGGASVAKVAKLAVALIPYSVIEMQHLLIIYNLWCVWFGLLLTCCSSAPLKITLIMQSAQELTVDFHTKLLI